MIYQTKLENTYSQLEVPIYDELGRKIGTAKVRGDKAEVTITQNPELIEKMMKENLVRTKSIFCHFIKL